MFSEIPATPFDVRDASAMALEYLRDPSDVHCPTCGPGTVEVVAFLDPDALEAGRPIRTDPTGDYVVVLHCHGCRRASGLQIGHEDEGADWP